MKKLFLLLALVALSCAGSANAQGVPTFGGMGVPSAAPGVQANLAASVDPTVGNDKTQGYQVGSLWQNSSTGSFWIARDVSTGAAVWNKIPVGDSTGYIANRWYMPFGVDGTITAGSSAGANSIRFYPFLIRQRATLSSLGSRISTASAGGNIQFAIYGNDSTACKPTGTALVSTASISTTSTGIVNSAASVQLNPGLYWMASNADNATVVMGSMAITGLAAAGKFCGSAAQTDVFASTQTMVGYSFAQTFNTWPDMTSNAVSTVNASSMPIVTFQVGSVP